MRKQEMQDLNVELVELLASLRQQIDDKLDELDAVDEDADEDDETDDEADED